MMVVGSCKAQCKHCNEPIRFFLGAWVHEDPDEDPTEIDDYGWVKCSGETTLAEPKEAYYTNGDQK